MVGALAATVQIHMQTCSSNQLVSEPLKVQRQITMEESSAKRRRAATGAAVSGLSAR